MSVLIKGMEMPKNCHNCELLTRIEVTYGAVYACQILNEVIGNVMVRQIHCPLVEVPPHGRLIDADKLKEEFPHDEDWDYPVNTNSYVVETIDKSPTIIEAEEEEHGRD